MGKVLMLAALAICGLATLGRSGKIQNPLEAPPCPEEPSECALPDCRCSSQAIPGDLDSLNIPQIVFLTFDDAITITNHPFYQDMFSGRTNPNGAKISVTFFVSHEYNNYSMIHDLYRNGHEIALHSITHNPDTQYWSKMNETMWGMEITNQREQMAAFANIPADSIKGMRAPFLQTSGDSMYTALIEGGFAWECSRPTWNFRVPGMWPYTNDYASNQDCQITPCPVEAHPGFWTIPMLDFIGGDSFPCAMVDECTPVPMTSEDTYDLLVENFNAQYNGNRAPFGVFAHAAWLVGEEGDEDRPEFPERTEGYRQFLNYLSDMSDVYIVSISKGLEWVKNPTMLADIGNFDPWKDPEPIPNGCMFPRNCRYSNSTFERYMSSCIACPLEYPWVDNHLGSAFQNDL